MNHSALNNVLRKVGYVIKKTDSAPSIIDLRRSHNNARASLYYQRPTVVDVDLREGIGLHHFCLGTDGFNPFVHAVRAALKKESIDSEASASVLKTYYCSVQPKNAAAWVGFNDLDIPALAKISAPGVVQPWMWQCPEEAYQFREKGVPRENKLAGVRLPFSDGWHGCGPVSDAKIAIESKRLCRLIKSVRINGLLRHDEPGGDIEADLLCDEKGNTRWWIVSGHHRAAVLSAMGFQVIPVRIRLVVDRGDVHIWPNVVSGIYKRNIALKLFDRLMKNELPPLFSLWKREVQEKYIKL